jgi:glycine hydroxymethyltransferase
VNGNKMEKACDLVHITLNKNAVVGDVSALAPGGVRIGAPAMTSRGLKEADFETIADFLTEVRSRLLLPCAHTLSAWPVSNGAF